MPATMRASGNCRWDDSTQSYAYGRRRGKAAYVQRKHALMRNEPQFVRMPSEEIAAARDPAGGVTTKVAPRTATPPACTRRTCVRARCAAFAGAQAQRADARKVSVAMPRAHAPLPPARAAQRCHAASTSASPPGVRRAMSVTRCCEDVRAQEVRVRTCADVQLLAIGQHQVARRYAAS